MHCTVPVGTYVAPFVAPITGCLGVAVVVNSPNTAVHRLAVVIICLNSVSRRLFKYPYRHHCNVQLNTTAVDT